MQIYNFVKIKFKFFNKFIVFVFCGAILYNKKRLTTTCKYSKLLKTGQYRRRYETNN